MKTRRRIRGTIKWGGAVVTVLLLIVWVGSAWYAAYWILDSSAQPPVVVVASGRLAFGYDTPAFHQAKWDITRRYPSFGWWFEFDRDTRSSYFATPLWCLALLSAAPTFLIWRHDRKRPPGTCRKCGYSRTGLPAVRACPECGTAP